MTQSSSENYNITVVDGDYIGGILKSSMTKCELKLLFHFIDRLTDFSLTPHSVCFEHGEIEEIFGSKSLTGEDLLKKTLNLSRYVQLYSSKDDKSYKLIQVFEHFSYEEGADGFWKFTIDCSPSAMEFLFLKENVDDFKYKLHYIIELSNKYSALLFMLLDNERSNSLFDEQGVIKVRYELDFLKRVLKCEDKYNSFNAFYRDVIKKAHSDIIRNTFLRFNFVPIYDIYGVKSGIEFSIYNNDSDYTLDDFEKKDSDSSFLKINKPQFLSFSDNIGVRCAI